jgi:hypothetical protein
MLIEHPRRAAKPAKKLAAPRYQSRGTRCDR